MSTHDAEVISKTVTALPIVVEHQLPAQRIEVVPADLVDRFQAAVRASKSLTITDLASLALAEANVTTLHRLAKELDELDEKVRRPVKSVYDAMRKILQAAVAPVDEAKRNMQQRIADWNDVAKREAAAAAAKAEAERAQAQAAADAFAALQAADALADQQGRQRAADAKAEAARVARQAELDQEAEELFQITGVREAPVAVAIPAEVAPLVRAPAAPVIAAAVVAPPAISKTIQVSTVKEVRVSDPALVPAFVGGIEVRPINMARLREALDMGHAVPGAMLVLVPQIGMGRAQP